MTRVGVLVVVVVVALAVSCRGGAGTVPDDDEPEAAPALVRCAPVVMREVRDVTEMRGALAPIATMDTAVSALGVGVIAKILVEPGQTVVAGALLAVIADPTLTAGTSDASAAVKGALAVEHNAELELARFDRLVTAGVGAQRDRDAADARLSTARAERSAAQGRQLLAGRQLANAAVRAPHAGTVVRIWRHAGELVDGSAATPVLELADLGTLEVRAQVPAASLGGIVVGDAAEVRFDAQPGALVVGRVVAVPLMLDAASGLGEVRIAVTLPTDAPHVLGAGAAVRVVRASRLAATIPLSAVRRSAVGEPEVVTCVGQPASTITIAPVDLARSVVDAVDGVAQVEIVDGLAGGARVVVDHALGLEPAQAITEAAP